MSDTPRTDAESVLFHDGDRIDWVRADFARSLERENARLAAELAEARNTNSRLNRRAQNAESAIKNNDIWFRGFSEGSIAERERNKKRLEQSMADYKHATRTEMSELRAKAERLAAELAETKQRLSDEKTSYTSVTELCADHPNLMEYIKQVKNDLAEARDALRAVWPYVQQDDGEWINTAEYQAAIDKVRKVVNP